MVFVVLAIFSSIGQVQSQQALDCIEKNEVKLIEKIRGIIENESAAIGELTKYMLRFSAAGADAESESECVKLVALLGIGTTVGDNLFRDHVVAAAKKRCERYPLDDSPARFYHSIQSYEAAAQQVENISKADTKTGYGTWLWDKTMRGTQESVATTTVAAGALRQHGKVALDSLVKIMQKGGTHRYQVQKVIQGGAQMASHLQTFDKRPMTRLWAKTLKNAGENVMYKALDMETIKPFQAELANRALSKTFGIKGLRKISEALEGGNIQLIEAGTKLGMSEAVVANVAGGALFMFQFAPDIFEAGQAIFQGYSGDISARKAIHEVGTAAGKVSGSVLGGYVGQEGGAHFGKMMGGAIGEVAGRLIGGMAGTVGGRLMGEAALDTFMSRVLSLSPVDALEKAYQFFGAHPSASNRELNQAYRELALKYHPDTGSPDASTEKMMEVNVHMDLIKAARMHGNFHDDAEGSKNEL